MKTNGNLYWKIEFTGLYNGAGGCNACEEAHVSVESHDFADAYRKAGAMYGALVKTLPDKVYCAHITLRDDGSASPSNHHGIYTIHYIDSDRIAAFFSAGAERCMAFAYRG